MLQITKDINLKVWENSHYLKFFLATAYVLY